MLQDSGLKDLNSVAVIGAGMAGLGCAAALSLDVADVVVFEQRSSGGGRMVGSRIGGMRYDDACLPFAVADRGFREVVASWCDDGWVEPVEFWLGELRGGRLQTCANAGLRYVSGSSSGYLAQRLAELLRIQFMTPVHGIATHGGRYHLFDRKLRGLGDFDAVLVATPPGEAARLLKHTEPDFSARAARVRETPLWVATLWFESPIGVPYGEVRFPDSPILDRAVNLRALPGRSKREVWVIHARADWSAAQSALSVRVASHVLGKVFVHELGVRTRTTSAFARQWRVTDPETALGEGCLFDAERSIGVCGDWCAKPTVESAYLSGLALAEQVLSSRHPRRLRAASAV